MCCKELGHNITDCPRDPNLKTRNDNELDYERIQRIKDYRKLFADTMVLTTHFLKKCVLVPFKHTKAAKAGTESKGYLDNPFKRGCMKFEDYNYSIINPYILIEDTNNSGPQQEGLVDLKSIAQKGPKLTEKQLEQNVSEDYTHHTLSVTSPKNAQIEEEDDL